MPQITNLRLLLSTATHLSPLKLSSLSSLSKLKPLHRSHKPLAYPFSCISSSSSSSSSRNPRNDSRKPLNLTRKSTSSLERDKVLKMEGSGGAVVGFNKKRAEGKDKSDRPKDLKLKVRKLNPVNTICYVQVLGTGMDTQDTSPSVLLFFDKQRFIFNAGEGLQRFCTEHKIKLSKIDHIFLSRVCSETAGGLPGLLLTLAGTGDEGMSVNLWGPSEFKYLVDAMKSFIPNAAMVHSRCFGQSPRSDGASFQDFKKSDGRLILIDDEVVKISAILLRPNCAEDDGLIPEPLQHSPKHKAESILKPVDISVVYICELPEIRGKFDPKKAAALGLRAGPKYRELQEGKSVMSDNKQRMIHPSDVLGPSVPGPVVLLVDCPTMSHLQELLAVQSLTPYYADMPGTPHEASKTVNSVIHLSPSSVVNSIDYQKWMSKFGGAEHIMAGHEMKNIEVPILKSSARVAARLNYLCPQFFPAPGFWPLQQLKCSTTSSELGSVLKLCEATSAENLLKFHLRPYAQLGLDRSCIPARTSSPEIIDDLRLEIPEIVDAAQQVSKFWNGVIDEKVDIASTEGEKKLTEEPWLNESTVPSCLDNITREDAEIVLLGTGSSQPSKYRNVTSIFINLFSKGSLLLDCGEGTLGQLKRRYGIEGADDAVKSLRCIWISHIHADHHTGLARVLALRRDLLKGVPHEPLIVVGPPQLKRFLDAYERLEDLDMQFLDCRHTTEASGGTLDSSSYDVLNGNKVNQHADSNLFTKGSQMQSYWKRPVDSGISFSILKNLKNVLENAGLETLISFPVVHCPQAFGVALKAADRVNSVGKKIPGWKIVYSGDTRPCPELIKASQGATVLIHEATFEDGLVDEAIARNHSTTKEAIEVGESAGVYRIILTHFSQRYPKIPVFDESHMHKTCIAFDMMSINMADLRVLPRVLPYLKLLFKNEMIVDETDDIETVAAMAV